MSFFSNNDELRCSKTLGKSNEFLWKIDSECNMYLSRVFNLENGKTNVEDFITADELKKLDNYMSDGEWKHLANNVSKLQDGTEKEGVGTFLFSELQWSNTKAQLSGNIGSIFCAAGAWKHNGKKRGIQFKKNSDIWCDLVKAYYSEDNSKKHSFEK